VFRAYYRMLNEAVRLLVSVSGPSVVVLIVGFTAVLALQDKLALHGETARVLTFGLFVVVWVCFFAMRGDVARMRRQLRDQVRSFADWESTSAPRRAYVWFLCRALAVQPPAGAGVVATVATVATAATAATAVTAATAATLPLAVAVEEGDGCVE